MCVDAEHRLLADVSTLFVVEQRDERRLEREVILVDIAAVAEKAGVDPQALDDRIALRHRVRVIAFTVLTPFYFLKAGSLVRADVHVTSAGLILIYLAVKMATKFVGILPLTRIFRFDPREGMYTTLLMSTGLTFGTISALFGLTNHIIDQRQYTILVTAVIGTARIG